MVLTKQSLAQTLEFLFICGAFLLISDALTPLLYPIGRVEPDAGDSNVARLGVATVTYLIACLLLLPRWRVAVQFLARRPEIVVLAVLPIISAIWAPDFGPVVRRSLAHAMTLTFCLYVVCRYSADELFDRLILVLAIGMFGSIAIAILYPEAGVTHGLVNDGAWRGVYGHKAIAGRVCAFAVFICLLHKPANSLLRSLRWPTLAATLVVSYMSQSRTSWLLIIAGIAAMIILAFLRWRRLSQGLRLTICLIVGAAVAFAAFFSFDDLIELLGRDSSLSGRTTLWESAIDIASNRHPWLGSGYRDFWLGPAADEIAKYIPQWVVPNHGHNGYLDTWLELGWVGVALLVFFLLRNTLALFTRAVYEPMADQWQLLVICVFIFIVNNMSASVALAHTDLAWVMVVLASLYSARSAYARRGYVQAAPEEWPPLAEAEVESRQPVGV